MIVSLIFFFIFGDFSVNFQIFSKSFWRGPPISPTTGKHTHQCFAHNSGSTAQNPAFFGASVAESQCATCRSVDVSAETTSAGPQTQFFDPPPPQGGCFCTVAHRATTQGHSINFDFGGSPPENTKESGMGGSFIGDLRGWLDSGARLATPKPPPPSPPA